MLKCQGLLKITHIWGCYAVMQPDERLTFIKLINDVIEELEELKLRLEKLERQIANSGQGERQRLAQLLARHFSEDDLDSLAFELNLNGDYEGAGSRAAKARRLVQVCERRDMIGELIELCQRERPKAAWTSQ